MGVSYVIPAYKAAPYIEEAIRSVESNWHDDDQLIVVEDCSDDNGATQNAIDRAVAKFRGKDSVFLLSNMQNVGGGQSRNFGNAEAVNEFIFALDADNILEPNSVDKLVAALDSDPKADIAAFETVAFFKHGTQKITSTWIFPAEVTLAQFLTRKNLPPSAQNFLHRKKLWDEVKYPVEAGAMDTWAWGLRTLMHGAKLITVPNTRYLHRQGIESYWIRDNRNNHFDEVATRLMWPYLGRLDEESQRLVLDPKSEWYSNLEKQPLKLKGPI